MASMRAVSSGLLVFAGAVAFSLASTAQGATRTWVGGNDPWDTDPFNWSGNDEPDPDDDAVFNTNNKVEMAMDNVILSLDMSNGIELDTESFFLDVNGDITLSDAGTILRAGESDTVGLPATSVSTYNVSVNSGATYANANFTSFLSPTTVGVFDINSDGTLRGHGTIRNGDGLASPIVVFENDGVIRPGSVIDGLIGIGGTPTARTLTLAAIDGDARIDLDGTTGGGALDVTRNQTLDIDVQLNDDFDGVIDLAHNSTLDIEDAWQFAGTMNVDNGFVPGQTMPFIIPAIPADVAFLQGGQITMNESTTTINVLDEDGTLQFDALFTADDGTIANNGLIVFNEDTTINSSVDFQLNGVTASMTVGPGASVVINDADMDFDGSGASTNVITVEAGGLLDLNLDSFEGNDRADGFLTLNSGSLSLTVTDGSWTMERRLTLNNTGGGSPTLSGSAVVIGDDSGFNGAPDADVRVEGNGSSQINVPVTWNSDAEVDVAAGATLAITGFSTFNTVNGAESAQFDGPGDIFFSGGQVNEATTLDFSGGTVGLDSGGGFVVLLSAPDFTIDAPLTINAAEVDEYGRSVVFPVADSSVLTVNASIGGRLNVNLDNPSDSWTVNGVGVVNINGGAILFSTFLTGNRLDMNGAMTVDGFSNADAPITIGATGVVNFNDALANLRLRGGDLVNTNRIEDGAINGPGEISAIDAIALHGHGEIGAAIDFDGSASELLADDGTLMVSGAILDVGIIGTADNDGVLNVANPWNTNVAAGVRLDGGELTGSTITNDGSAGIRGRGLVSARVQNNTVIVANAGSTLDVDNPLNNNDWDGAGGAGALRATAGSTLDLHDNSTFLFTGTVAANSATVRALGFALEFEPGSTLSLENNGIYRSTNATNIGGAVTVGPGAPSRIMMPGTVVLENTSATTLTGDLILDNTITRVEVGATFAGGGILINPLGSDLVLEDGANVGVLIENRGTLLIGGSPGQSAGSDFEQTGTGVWEVEIAGTSLTDIDRMTLTGAANLAGTLDVSLLGGFMPNLGDSFPILSAPGGVIGTFDTENLPMLMMGNKFAVSYNPTNVVLEVIMALLEGDANKDMQVTGADLISVQQNFGSVGPVPLQGDANNDGQVTGADLISVQQNFGMIGGDSPVAPVPEPGTALLLCFGLGHSAWHRRRQRELE